MKLLLFQKKIKYKNKGFALICEFFVFYSKLSLILKFGFNLVGMFFGDVLNKKYCTQFLFKIRA